MPRFYEEAARLLLLIIGRGVVIAPGIDYQVIVRSIAMRLEQILLERRSHAESANALLDALTSSGLASIDAMERKRLVALAGTVIGNLMIMTRARS